MATFRHPDSGAPESPYQRGLEALATSRYPVALTIFDELSREKATAAHLYHRGLCHFRLGQIEAARNDYDAALALEPEYVDALWRRGQTLSGTAAIASFDAALGLDPACVAAMAERGRARMSAGELERALADFDAALQLAPEDFVTRQNRSLLRIKQREWALALEDILIAVASPQARGSRLLRDLHYNAGFCEYQQTHWAEAAPHFDAALAVNASDYQSLALLVGCYVYLGRHADAEARLATLPAEVEARHAADVEGLRQTVAQSKARQIVLQAARGGAAAATAKSEARFVRAQSGDAPSAADRRAAIAALVHAWSRLEHVESRGDAWEVRAQAAPAMERARCRGHLEAPELGAVQMLVSSGDWLAPGARVAVQGERVIVCPDAGWPCRVTEIHGGRNASSGHAPVLCDVEYWPL